MNKLASAILGATVAVASASAFAGPDWQLIEKARKHEHVQAPALSKETAGPRGTVRFAQQDGGTMMAMGKECADMMQSRK